MEQPKYVLIGSIFDPMSHKEITEQELEVLIKEAFPNKVGIWLNLVKTTNGTLMLDKPDPDNRSSDGGRRIIHTCLEWK